MQTKTNQLTLFPLPTLDSTVVNSIDDAINQIELLEDIADSETLTQLPLELSGISHHTYYLYR